MPIAGEDLVGALEDLRRAVRSIEGRVAALEARAVEPTRASQAYGSASTTGAAGGAESGVPIDAVGLAALTGQGVLGLAGAYLLRALTEQGALPTVVGYTAGAAYACAWFALADRAGRAGASLRAATFGTVACSVAYPLTWEAATRSHLIGAFGSGLALAGTTGAALLVAARIRLQGLAWVAAIVAVATSVALLPGTERLVPVTVFVVGLGVATLWLGYVRDWFALRWPVAAVANLLVCWVVFSVPPGRGLERPATAVALGLLLPAAYLGSTLVRTLWRARDVLPFEVVQGFASVGVGIGGALMLGPDGGTRTVGAATLMFGAACYLAGAFAARQRGFSTNFLFYTTMALALVLTGVMLLLAPPEASLALSLLAVVVGAVAARRGLSALVVHAAFYAGMSAVASNLLVASTTRLVGSLDGHWSPLNRAATVAALASAVCFASPRGARVPWPLLARSARLVLLGLAMLGIAAWAVEFSRPLFCVGAGVDAGVLATVRTAIIALAAVALAWLARTAASDEALWMTYAALVLGGLKLLMEDFPGSRPATLFIGLAAYGGALIVAPGLARRRR